MSFLKNYTTIIKAFVTISEIESMLANHKAKGVMKEFDSDGNVKLIYFMLETEQGDIAYKLPCDIMKVKQTLTRLAKSKKIKLRPHKYNSLEHASNVGWRIIKDWLHSQLSLIQIELASLEQVFLPYAFNPNTNQTFFEKVKESNYRLLLESGGGQ